MSKQVILTGLRANNDLHIGNYLGALLPIVDMANSKAGEYQVNLFVPDLHSFTTPMNHKALQDAIMNNLRMFVAAGLPLDNPDVHIYRQSYIPAHSELTWILDCFTGMGEMSRMTQFKDKSRIDYTSEEFINSFINYLSKIHPNYHKELMEFDDSEFTAKTAPHLLKIVDYFQELVNERQKRKATVGLFNYPVLMAADILLYGSSYVPVGDDQSQHLEFARDIAQHMNSQLGELFTIPKPVKEQHAFFGKDQGLRIKDLADPTKKMSKSDETGKGVIFLTDSPNEARKKITAATTDSLNMLGEDVDPTNQPGVYNLLQIASLLATNQDEMPGMADYKNYGGLKEAVSNVVVKFLSDFQSKLAAVDDSKLIAKLQADEQLMNEQANTTLLKVQKAVGLRP